MNIRRSGSQPSGKGPAEYFNGTVRIDPLFNPPETARAFGADEVVVSRDADAMQKRAGSFDFILDAVSADRDINAYIQLLRRDGNITLVGAPDFCGAHNFTADVEVIPVQKVNEACERLLKADVKYRFSIDMASIKSE